MHWSEVYYNVHGWRLLPLQVPLYKPLLDLCNRLLLYQASNNRHLTSRTMMPIRPSLRTVRPVARTMTARPLSTSATRYVQEGQPGGATPSQDHSTKYALFGGLTVLFLSAATFFGSSKETKRDIVGASPEAKAVKPRTDA